MKVLIIGSEGFIGSNLVAHWAGDQLFTADVISTRHTRAKQHYLLTSESFETPFREVLPDVCINASGAADVSASFSNPAKDRRLNFENVQHMLEAVRTHAPSTRFINISSAAVYGSAELLPIPDDRADLLHPISPYGKHKLEAERLLIQSATDGLRTLSARVFSCYGEGQKKLLLWDIFQKSKATNFKRLELLGSGEQTRDYLNVQDLVRAFQRLSAHAELFDGRAVNVASGVQTSILQVAELAAKQLNPSMTIHFSGEEHKGHPAKWCADVSQLNQLDFEPHIELKEGIKKYYEWVRSLND